MKTQLSGPYFFTLSLLLGIMLTSSMGQDVDQDPKFAVNGYVKYLHSTTFQDLNGNSIGVNLIHNRLNLKAFPLEGLTIAVEARNRAFWGQQVVFDTTFSDQIDQYDGWADLSVRWVDKPGLLLHSIVDRAYVDYINGDWEIRAGRQRINWGINLTWNPNDWFNALNFLDFDYEERPGSDGIRIQYYTGLLSHAEIAAAVTDSQVVAAALYRFNLKGYDVQALTGYVRGDYAVGLGWEGNIGGAGFKGELSYFIPIEGQSPDTITSFQGTISADYVFGNGIYVSGGILYNSNGSPERTAGGEFSNNALATTSLSPKNLFPATWTILATGSHQITPLFSVNLSGLFSPEAVIPPVIDGKLLLLFPTFTYSIKENWDIDLIGQSYFADTPIAFQHLSTGIFFRLKWSY